MLSDFDLSKLPSLFWSQKASLPNCPAVYFVVDSENRVLYVGKATNLLARWKDHHRFEQLNKINRKIPLRLAWLECSLQKLDATEKLFIENCLPLLNSSSIPAKKIIPTEVALQRLLNKVAKYMLVIGMVNKTKDYPTTVFIKYQHDSRSVSNIVQTALRNFRKNSSLKGRKYLTRSSCNWYDIHCNGISINIAPWSSCSYYYNYKSSTQRILNTVYIAGSELKALSMQDFIALLAEQSQPEQNFYLFRKEPWLKEIEVNPIIVENDPIPLRWFKY